MRLLSQERLNLELRARQEQLLSRTQQQQVSLQREERLSLTLAEVGSHDAKTVCYCTAMALTRSGLHILQVPSSEKCILLGFF